MERLEAGDRLADVLADCPTVSRSLAVARSNVRRRCAYPAAMQLLLDESPGRIVPLGPEARTVLGELAREGGNPWAMMAGRLHGARLTDLQRPREAHSQTAGLKDARIHDLRRSFASRALALGEGLPMIGKLHRQSFCSPYRRQHRQRSRCRIALHSDRRQSDADRADHASPVDA